MADANPKPGRKEVERLVRDRDAALQTAREAIRDATRVTRLLAILNEPAPAKILLDRVLSTLSELFMADIGAIIDPAMSGAFRPIASIGLPEDEAEGIFASFDMPRAFSELRASAALGPKELEAFLLDPRLSGGLGIAGLAWIPTNTEEEAQGALILIRISGSPFSGPEIDLLSAMAYRVAVALEQLQWREQLEAMARTDRELGWRLDRLDVAREAVRTFPDIAGAEAAAILIYLPGGVRELEAASEGLDEGAAGWILGSQLPEPDALCFDGEPLRLTPGSALFPRSSSAPPYRSILAAPLDGGRMCRRVLLAFRSQPVAFTAETARIAGLYARKLAAAFENAALYQALRESEEKAKALLGNISDVVAVIEPDFIVASVAEAVRSAWGMDPDSLIGAPLLDFVHPDDAESARTGMGKTLENPDKTAASVLRLRFGETEPWRSFDVIFRNLIVDKSIGGIVATFHDITERRILEKELSELALTDALTGLANRKLFLDRLRESLEREAPDAPAPAVIYFDLDDFKIINDRLGHAAGDRTLKAVADRLRDCLRKDDTPARLGGDEFTVLIETIRDFEILRNVVRRLQTTITAPIALEDGTEVKVGCSVGIALGEPGDDADGLLRKADAAMYQAKKEGKGGFVVFRPGMDGRGP